MTDIEIKKRIEKQIIALREATARATVSKEAAIQYLISAGIIEQGKYGKSNKNVSIKK